MTTTPMLTFPHAEITASELTALASWAESACKAMDRHNGEGDK